MPFCVFSLPSIFIRYVTARASRENSTGGGDGIETLKNEPYEKDGNKGRYTYRVCHTYFLSISSSLEDACRIKSSSIPTSTDTA